MTASTQEHRTRSHAPRGNASPSQSQETYPLPRRSVGARGTPLGIAHKPLFLLGINFLSILNIFDKSPTLFKTNFHKKTRTLINVRVSDLKQASQN